MDTYINNVPHKNKKPPSMDDITKTVSAFAAGALGLPAEVAKYAGVGWNIASNLPKEEIARRNKELVNYFDEGKYLNKGTRDYFNWLKDESPNAATAGEVGLATVLSAPTTPIKTALSLATSSVPAFRQMAAPWLKRWAKEYGVAASGVAAAETGKELVVEPELNKAIEEGLYKRADYWVNTL